MRYSTLGLNPVQCWDARSRPIFRQGADLFRHGADSRRQECVDHGITLVNLDMLMFYSGIRLQTIKLFLNWYCAWYLLMILCINKHRSDEKAQFIGLMLSKLYSRQNCLGKLQQIKCICIWSNFHSQIIKYTQRINGIMWISWPQNIANDQARSRSNRG